MTSYQENTFECLCEKGFIGELCEKGTHMQRLVESDYGMMFDG